MVFCIFQVYHYLQLSVSFSTAEGNIFLDVS
jgi:hypothetical protein